MARIINLHSAFINREMKAILDQIFIACNALRVWNYSKREKEKGKKGILAGISSDKLGMAELCVYRRAQVVQWSGRRWKIFRKYVLDSSRITIGKVDARGRGGREGEGENIRHVFNDRYRANATRCLPLILFLSRVFAFIFRLSLDAPMHAGHCYGSDVSFSLFFFPK